MLKVFYDFKNDGFKLLNFNLLPPLNYENVELKLNEDLIKFLNNHINQIIINNKKIEYNKIIELIIKLHGKEVEFNNIIKYHVDNHTQQIDTLDKLREVEHNKLVEANNKLVEANNKLLKANNKFLKAAKSYNDFNETFYNPYRQAYEDIWDQKYKELSLKLNKEIELEIDEFKKNKLNKFLNKFIINKKKSTPNLSLSDISKNLNSSSNILNSPSPSLSTEVGEGTADASAPPIGEGACAEEGGRRTSIDSNRTIKQETFNKKKDRI
jgi:hypothetical protein